MDDLAQKLSELLGSPDGMQKLQAAAASMGILTGNKNETTPSTESVSAALPSILEGSGFAGGDMEALRKLMPLVTNFKQDDQDTLLLKAIRPYLQDDRRDRLDETIKIMHMLKALPLLKDKGVL